MLVNVQRQHLLFYQLFHLKTVVTAKLQTLSINIVAGKLNIIAFTIMFNLKMFLIAANSYVLSPLVWMLLK